MTTNETHESYISIETAKMLKEAGFDWKCHSCYSNGEFKEFSLKCSSYFEVVIMDFNSAPDYMEQYSAPTLSVVQRWLRETKKYELEIVQFWSDWKFGWHFTDPKHNWERKLEQKYDTYEEAFEEGIKNCLTIILSKKRKKRK